ncbi:hypothetical protein DRW41_10880 [Neobacillus piezotolerans]|uniref:DUF3139 domain-containing protein n=1 Tax=Neobacillus piezotolerans TaxID=2259171 RepID=A0A3D8GSY5_9BACI|nr:hypothetical protein [Neobacillus piezotolerans]RDU37176.1 hypothetical protein DRW41_10880 [Neobacillus piezotolerans]
MHPISVIEVSLSFIFVIVTFGIALLFPKKYKKLTLMIASLLSVLLLLYFTIRPFWIDYQVSKKMDLLNQYLREEYPDQEWSITRREGRQYNPYHLDVEFMNEKGWVYTYSLVNEKNICQSAWAPQNGKLPREGKHFESKPCE